MCFVTSDFYAHLTVQAIATNEICFLVVNVWTLAVNIISCPFLILVPTMQFIAGLLIPFWKLLL
jgi:hypothetical protein